MGRVFLLPILRVDELFLIPEVDAGRAGYHLPTPHRLELHSICAILLRLLLITQALSARFMAHEGLLMLTFLSEPKFLSF